MPRGLCGFYPGMQAFMATDSSGVEGIYAGQGLPDMKRMYTPKAGVKLAGVSGSKYALYWAEYDADGAWRVMQQRFGEGAVPEVLKSGEGAVLPPVFHDGRMLLTENVEGALTSRLLVLDVAHDHPMEHRPPVWMDIPYRLAVQDFYVNGDDQEEGLSMLFESEKDPISRGFTHGSGSLLIAGDAPVACDQQNERTVWLTQTGKLFLHERLSKNTFMLAEDVTWFHIADSDILYADQSGSRVCVAQALRNPSEEPDPYALHEWRTGVVQPPEEGVTYLAAVHEHSAILTITLMAEHDGEPFLKLLYIGSGYE